MIIKLTRRVARADMDGHEVYVNTDYITDFYEDYIRILNTPILCTIINLTDCTITVAESP